MVLVALCGEPRHGDWVEPPCQSSAEWLSDGPAHLRFRDCFRQCCSMSGRSTCRRGSSFPAPCSSWRASRATCLRVAPVASIRSSHSGQNRTTEHGPTTDRQLIRHVKHCGASSSGSSFQASIILKNRIYAPLPRELNDPREARPRFPNVSAEDLSAYLQRVFAAENLDQTPERYAQVAGCTR